MKMKDVYYLNEPEDLTSDKFEARVLTQPDPGEEGGYEYSFAVTTLKFITDWMARNSKPHFCFCHSRAVLIVPKLDDGTVLGVIRELLPVIDKLAHRVE